MAGSAAARAILISRAADLSLNPTFLPPQPPPSHHLLIRPLLPVSSPKRRSPISCLISGVDGGGVSDEFVSTRKSGFGREFSVIANMLRRIEPLDNSIIAKGVSDSAKDSMKQTISTMLGLLPSDQFSVTVRFSKHPLNRLIVSSIITGYTLWNAEYRISLMRNFDISPDSSERSDIAEKDGDSEVRCEEGDGGGGEKGVGGGGEGCAEELERMNLQNLGKLSPEALKYIHQLESEVSAARQELLAQRQENLQMEHIRTCNNNLLEYLRSLESDMVTELSRPSAPEVEEIIHQLAQNTLRRFFKNENASDYDGSTALSNMQNYQDADNEFCDTVSTSRDYLAKLLFWCMLLGHHLRGLENRLHLSCVVGLL
ncbi:hypothetical protein BUALT_Bualt04G0153000 [Buddleja alternifolia]|uniref:Seed maturation-like protein n=1 Tax=Buddleja alternifolia TaxID=168488 RepID=A0AAV6XWI9_9LAMI|nr:hypothetical protein BUALT_Bualt04G0153000 [Buddleja alternifolia]